MLVPPPLPFRSLLSGLGCAALLYGAPEAWSLGPAVWVPYGALAVTMGALWRHRSRKTGARPAPVAAVPGLARLAQEPRRLSLASVPAVTPEPQRSLGSRVKLWVGGVGFVGCALWWLLLGALLFMPDPAPALDGLFTSNFLPLVTVSLLMTLLFVVVLRSGLRGPADPLAADQHGPTRPGDASVPSPTRPEPSPAGGKRAHLRLVRDS
ncbi:hypothetical protein I3V78_23620 [Archangium primigenium]|nr:hypothetical protein [Archangium primigenium]